jgi:hypothetical protein
MRMQVFLASGERTYTVGEGDVIDNTYRIDQIAPSQMSFTYLPLGQRQQLAVGDAL